MENAVGEGRRVYGLVDKKATDINYTLQHSLGQRILEITNRLYTVLKRILSTKQSGRPQRRLRSSRRDGLTGQYNLNFLLESTS